MATIKRINDKFRALFLMLFKLADELSYFFTINLSKGNGYHKLPNMPPCFHSSALHHHNPCSPELRSSSFLLRVIWWSHWTSQSKFQTPFPYTMPSHYLLPIWLGHNCVLCTLVPSLWPGWPFVCCLDIPSTCHFTARMTVLTSAWCHLLGIGLHTTSFFFCYLKHSLQAPSSRSFVTRQPMTTSINCLLTLCYILLLSQMDLIIYLLISKNTCQRLPTSSLKYQHPMTRDLHSVVHYFILSLR